MKREIRKRGLGKEETGEGAESNRDMRVVLYAAGAYVLSTVALAAAPSTNLAFVAKPASSENRIFHPLASHQPYMSKHIRKGLGS